MAIKETLVCAGGHRQSQQREDRTGRCNVCGNPLVRSAFDDALPMRKMGANGRLERAKLPTGSVPNAPPPDEELDVDEEAV